MRPIKPYQVTVSYFGAKLAFKVYQIIQKNNVEIYQLRRRGLSYLVIKDNNNWSFMAVIEPCQELKDAIVHRLKKKLPDLYLPQKLNASN
ncbi:hypothetical protein [Mucilaginibacter psychrotolerans]|uniref:Uncharacterized protein n=1 Tax=Mucilaginibacter psychrotolerans TaxID=1524096 RepID=A0A4Y8SMF3_9SPHI|nr:hypothetical protein [Mucilaginibacter psychrotolerans]TFF39820.1 hypothetical protein E2R66_05510 [Mucilaginibacter psychrotolerans]